MLPKGLARKELAHRGLTELHLVASMHERKALMASLADGFVALPGGLGTLEEVLEILTWAQLGIHQKPVGVVDVDGYWTGSSGSCATPPRKASSGPSTRRSSSSRPRPARSWTASPRGGRPPRRPSGSTPTET